MKKGIFGNRDYYDQSPYGEDPEVTYQKYQNQMLAIRLIIERELIKISDATYERDTNISFAYGRVCGQLAMLEELKILPQDEIDAYEDKAGASYSKRLKSFYDKQKKKSGEE